MRHLGSWEARGGRDGELSRTRRRGDQADAEGTMIAHPSGAVYQRINGNWTLVIHPGDGATDSVER